MGAPWRFMGVASLVAGYLTTSLQEEWSRRFFVASIVGVWVSLFVCYCIYSVIIYPYLLSPLRALPEPTGNSFLHGQHTKMVKEPSGVPQTEWINNIPNNGLIRYRGFLNEERILVTNPKALGEVMVSKNYDFGKPSQFRFVLGRLLGVGILLAEGDEHRRQRKNLMPAFAFRHVKDLYPLFWSKGRESVQALATHIRREAAATSGNKEKEPRAAVEVGEWTSRATLDIIGAAGLGRDFGAIKDPQNELVKTYSTLFSPNRQAQLLGLLGLITGDWLASKIPVQRNNDVQAARRIIRSTCRDLIREKKEKLARKENDSVDILSVALESGGFTDENLVDQLMTFLAAGHETTATAMLWAIYMMCQFPEMQTRLREEVRANLPPLGDRDSNDASAAAAANSTISSLDIDRLPYLHAFCQEVLRYYSPVSLTVRSAAVDTTILGQVVPKGTRVVLCPWAVNRSDALWGADARKFDPERWLPKFDGDRSAASGGATSNYAFLTFLHGPRSCIGMAFAKAEFACLLAAWVGRFEFRIKDEEHLDESKLDIRGGVTSKPAGGLHVYAKVLDGW